MINKSDLIWIFTATVLTSTMPCQGALFGNQDAFGNRLQPRPDSFVRPFVIEFSGPIDWQLSKYLRSKIEQAKSAGADLIVVEIESPGGLKNESLNLAETLRDIDWAYTVAFIPQEALSGAALVSLGCDEIWIDDLARFGDIGVIEFDPQLFAFRFAPEKIQSVLIRQARDLAASKGRSPELAEAMIDKDFVVYQRDVNGRAEFLGQKSSDDEPLGEWEIVPETKKGFLTINGSRALSLGLANGNAADRSEVAGKVGFDINNATIIKRTFTDKVVFYLNHPIVTGLLILVGLIALFFELSAPGVGLGGLISGLCAALFFWSRFLGGTSTVLELVLFGAGIVFLLMELFVIPGWGISGAMGLLLLISSVFLASQDFVVPTTAREWNQFLTSLVMVLCSGTAFCVAAGLIVRHMNYIPVLSSLILTPPGSDDDSLSNKSAINDSAKLGNVDHPEISVGDWGESESLLRPAGRAIFAGQSFDVVSDGEFIEPGRQIRVLAISGNRIVVTAISKQSESGE